VCASPSSVAMDPVALTVHFKLADLDYKPIPNSTVRVTFGSDARWHFATIDHGCGGILVRNCQKKRLPAGQCCGGRVRQTWRTTAGCDPLRLALFFEQRRQVMCGSRATPCRMRPFRRRG
jgi:hypothetical protein